MSEITKVIPGEVLYFYPEDMSILITMSGDDGVRYIDPMNLEYDNNGNIITTYASYATLGEWTISLGSVSNISKALMGKSK